jgi:hypothetical protein
MFVHFFPVVLQILDLAAIFPEDRPPPASTFARTEQLKKLGNVSILPRHFCTFVGVFIHRGCNHQTALQSGPHERATLLQDNCLGMRGY